MAKLEIFSEPLPTDEANSPIDSFPFNATLQLRNAKCFILVRCLIALSFAGLSVLALIGQPLLKVFDVALTPGWPIILCVSLAVFNLFFWMHSQKLTSETPGALRINLWMQIIVDLIAVTFVVHRFGSLDTFSPFLYAIHIVIACVFFRPRVSFLVVALCAVLYLGCVGLESYGYICAHSIFSGPPLGQVMEKPRQLLHSMSGVAVWGAIWMLVGYLSSAVRKREVELEAANNELEDVYARQQQSLRHTSHQMKSPIHAIQSHVDLIVGGYVDKEVSDPMRKQLHRIDMRCRALSAFIGDVLSLAELQLIEKQKTHEITSFDLGKRILHCASAVESTATKRGIKLEFDIELNKCTLMGNERAMDMLLDNLMTNAVNYSYDGGLVRVGCQRDKPGGRTLLWVEDQGIGIPEEKLPNIFGEYFRTSEAKKHNPHSTGVGLAIAKQVATAHGADITVQSAPEEGTRFTISFPVCAE